MKLPLKIVICYLITILAVFLVINLYGNDKIERDVRERLKNEYSDYAAKLADEYTVLFVRGIADQEEVRTQLVTTSGLINARIWLVNSKNVVVIDTEGRYQPDLDVFDDTFLTHSYVEDTLLNGMFEEPMLCAISPIVFNYSIKGYICTLIPSSRIGESSVAYMNVVNTILLVMSIILFLAYAGIYFLVAYPTRKIRNAAIEYAKGNYDHPLRIVSHDEIRDLADSVTYMVGRIRDVDNYQKKFIGNVSHDFRSPLTSIKGYAEAMKDGTIPPEAQGKYLDIILYEADRLSKLTSNLLDLNRMDSQGVMLDITSFDLNPVIKSTAAAFEGICRQKKIVIELKFASAETPVDADMGRIQQVLYNLTDNAIKFSHQDSSIEIETEEKGSKVLVRVRDHGVGIPKDSIKKIWERFYKNDSSRGKDKRGTGLGLSIVKEVITAHNENISVVSTEGVGTEFTFTLAQSEEL